MASSGSEDECCGYFVEREQNPHFEAESRPLVGVLGILGEC